MNVGSLFSGIGGIDLGLERAGMRVVFQAEADPWRRAVLRAHWPDVRCYEDVRSVRLDGGRPGAGGTHGDAAGEPLACDLLCGGFPCQDLSVAGRRAGLAGSRSSLFFEFARIADTLRPTWLLVENVPGLLSSNGGRDFAVVYATLAELGYGLAWRVLDSRYFGVPQRRRRVFIVGHLGAHGADPFLPFLEGGERDSASGGTAGEDVAVASLSGLGTGGADDNDGQGGRLVTALQARDAKQIGNQNLGPSIPLVTAHDLAGTVRSHMRPGSNSYDSVVDVAYALRKDPGGVGQGHNTNYVAAPLSHGSHPNSNAAGRRREDDENIVALDTYNQTFSDVSPTLRDPNGTFGDALPAVVGQSVRRLTTTEACRLQGFPDDWLGPPNEPPDSPRYAALGDAVTVPVAEWVGRRILDAVSSAVAGEL